MPLRTHISGIGAYSPSRQQPMRERESQCRTKIRIPVERLTGIKTVCVAEEGEFAIDLARKAALDCLNSVNFDPGDIDILISCSIGRYDLPDFGHVFEPSTASRLKILLGTGNALAFDVSNACAGMFTGLLIADSFLRSGRARNVLVVSGELISPIAECAIKEISGLFDPRVACLTLGDGGAALLLNATDGDAGFEAMELYSLPEHSDLCVARTTSESHGGGVMLTRSAELGKVMAEELSGHFPHFFARYGYVQGDIDWVVPHQTSVKTIRSASSAVNKAMGWDLCNPTSVLLTLDKFGNTASTSHTLAIAENLRSGKVSSGDRVLFSVNASGLVVGSFVYRFGNLPITAAPAPATVPRSVIRTDIAAEAFRIVNPCERSQIDSYQPVVEEALQAAQVSVGDVELLIYCGVYREDTIMEPSMAALIAKACGLGQGLAERFLAFDVFAGPSGLLHAMKVAEQIMAIHGKKTALIVAGDADPNFDSDHAAPLGIAQTATAVILREGSSGGFGELHVTTGCTAEGNLVRHLRQIDGQTHIASRGHAKCPAKSEAALLDTVALALADGTKAPDLVLVPGNADLYRDLLSGHFSIPEERIVAPRAGSGRAFTANLAIALHEARADGRFVSGQSVLFVGFSETGEASALLYEA